ncbi:MAG: dihydrofolate reductase family protein [Methanothrix sp.]
MEKLEGSNSTLIKGDIVQEIKNLKQQNGPELQVPGSSNLIQTLLKLDLIDEFRLKIFPVTLGTGKRLFGDGTIPAGLKIGSFALETPTEAELARRKRLKEGK